MECTPWLSKFACEWLEENISPEWRILEIGGGGSTIWFAERCQHITCLEENPAWRDSIAEEADCRGLTNLTLVHQLPPFDKDTISTLSDTYDLILVDGPVKGMKYVRGGWRPWFVNRVHPFLDAGGYLMVDDINVRRIGRGPERACKGWRNIHNSWPNRGKERGEPCITGLWQKPLA